MKRSSSWLGLFAAIVVLGAACGHADPPAASGAGGAGGEGGAGGACEPLPEACDGVDQDCDSVPDDGMCSAAELSGELFINGTGVDHVRGVDFDSAGNVYITGAVTAPADIGGGQISGALAYVASYAPDGAFRWQFVWGNSSGYDYGQDVSASDNLVCVAGAFAGAFNFGGGLRVAGGYNDAVLLCLNASDGSYAFDRAFGADLSDAANGVAITPSGDVVVTGAFENSADFGAGAVQGIANNDMFVARYSPDGAFQWARTFPGEGSEHGEDIIVDASESAYVVGMFTSVIDFGGGPRDPSAVSNASLLLKLNQSGEYVWDFAATAGGGYTSFYSVDVSSTGSVVIGGEFVGDLMLGGPVVTSMAETSSDVFAASFDSSGKLAWQYTAGGPGSDRGFGVAVGPKDDVVLVGGFTDMTVFGDEERTSAGSYDVYIVGLTPAGAYQWDAVFGGIGEEEANAAAVSAAGRIAVGGETWGDLDLGMGSHMNGGTVDGLLFFLE